MLMTGFVVGLAMVLVIPGLWLAATSGPEWAGALSAFVRERRGQETYNALCYACHLGPTGGGIDDHPPRHNANGHTWHHPDCFLERITRDGSELRSELARPGAPKMPAFKDRLSHDDIAAVLAYIKTMWTPTQRELQASFTREMCF